MISRQAETTRKTRFYGYKRPQLQHETPFSQTILGESLFLCNRSRTNSKQTHVKNSIPDSLRAPEKIFQQYQYSLIFKRNRVQSACGMHPNKNIDIRTLTQTHATSELFRTNHKNKGRESGREIGMESGKESGKESGRKYRTKDDNNAKQRRVSLLCDAQTKSFMPSVKTRSKSATSRFT